jgi:hypothetical protein
MSEEKPFVAFVLCLLGGIFIMIGKLLLFDRVIIINIIVSMVLGTLVIIGALLISTDRIQNIRTGGLIVLISAMVSLFTISDRYYGYAYGYFLGFLGGVLLSIIGSILALAWKPKLTVAQRNP